jgi:thermitase
VGAPDGWEYSTGSPNVTIAVLDSGLDLDHPDIADNVWTNAAEASGLPGVDDDGAGYVDDVHGYDFCGDNVGDPYTDDIASEDPNPDVWVGEDPWWEEVDPDLFIYVFHGDASVGDYVDNNGDGLADMGVAHGTMASGIIGAVTNNGEGMAGIAWHCRLMAVRMLNAEGLGYGSDAFDALHYAADMGADVINCSWGAIDDPDDPDPDIPILEEGVQYAYNHGCVVVCAAGNEALEAGYDWGLDVRPPCPRQSRSAAATRPTTASAQPLRASGGPTTLTRARRSTYWRRGHSYAPLTSTAPRRPRTATLSGGFRRSTPATRTTNKGMARPSPRPLSPALRR